MAALPAATPPPVSASPSATAAPSPPASAPAGAAAAPLTAVERAVAVMSAMGKPVASRLVGYLSTEERARMLRAADRLPDIGPNELEAAVRSFEDAFIAGGGVRDNLATLEEVFDQRLDDGAGVPKRRSAWDMLAEEGGAAAVERLGGENPSLHALVLSKLPTGAGADMLRAMDAGAAGALLRRMSARREPSAAVLRAVERFLDTPKEAADADPGPIAAVLNELERDMADALLAGAKLAEPTEKRVRGAMFAFEDLGAMSAPDLAVILDEVEGETVAGALHGAGDALAEAIMSALSPRTRRMVEAQRRTANGSPDAVRLARRVIARRALALIGEGRVERPAPAT